MAKKKTAKKAAKKTTRKAAKKTAAPKKSAKKKAGDSGKKATAKKTARQAAKKPSAKKASSRKAPKATKPRKAKSAKKSRVKSPLSRKELSQFKEMLVEKRRSLIGDLNGMQGSALGRGLQESSGDLSNMPTHPADVGSDNFEQEFTLGLLASERELLREIEFALERIEHGTFGICVGTGEPIGKSRLTARPWCRYCIEYQRLIEKGLVRPKDDDDFEYTEDEDEDEDGEELEDEDMPDEDEDDDEPEDLDDDDIELLDDEDVD